MIIKRWDEISTRLYTPHLRLKEFFCQCGMCIDQIIDPELVQKLEQLRTIIDSPLSIVSGFRCYRHNATLKDASPHSMHLYGQAADVLSMGFSTVEIAKIGYKLGFNGIGVSDHFTHLDIRKGKFAFWVYNNLDLDIIKRDVTGGTSGL